MARQSVPRGWVWVTQTVDLTQQLGGEENIMTLDGEPLPAMQRRRITLGLILDDEGHIVTRLIDVLPNRPPLDITVRARGFIPIPARFLGMDTVSGLCVLKADKSRLIPANFTEPDSSRAKLNIRLYGFHPNQAQNFRQTIVASGPRTNSYAGQISKAIADFRYTANHPIYYLLSPKMTPVQDCSLILDESDSILGLAVYDTGSQGPHLVYPISQVQKIAQSMIKSHQSIAHGWLGATGRDSTITIPTATSKPINQEPGVLVLAIAPDSPADLAGVRPKDTILSINERRVLNYAQMASTIRQIPAGSDVTLKVKRGSEYKTLRTKLASAPSTDPEQQLIAFARQLETMEGQLKAMPVGDPNRQKMESRVGMMRTFVGAVMSPAPPEIRLRVFYGMEIQPLSGQLMSFFAVTNGILVSSVLDNNKASRSGVMAGDVILKVGDAQIASLATLIDALDKSPDDTVELTVSRRREQTKVKFQR